MSSIPCEPQQMPPIGSAIVELSTNLSTLEKSLYTLRDKIDPILTPIESPVIAVIADKALPPAGIPAPCPVSSVAATLQKYAMQVYDLNMAVNSILNKIEL